MTSMVTEDLRSRVDALVRQPASYSDYIRIYDQLPGDEHVMHTITVLHVPGCAGGKAALQIASAIEQTRPDVAAEDVVIEAEEDGIARGFRGSPTVLIDGRDIEPNSQTPLGSMG